MFLTALTPVHSLFAAGPWNGKPAAIVLSYDDGLDVHLDTVIPLLEKHDIRATFYVTGTAASLRLRSNDWGSAAEDGHELGNHTMFHPCSGSLPGRSWVKPDRDLDRYSYDQYEDEIAEANSLLASIDNKERRSFAYTCGDKKAGDQSIVDVIKNAAVAARGVNGGVNTLGQLDLYDLRTYSVSGQKAELLQLEAEKAIRNNGLVIFLFHGIGGEHDLIIERDQHRQFIEYLASRKEDFWIAPLIEIADFIVDNKLSESIGNSDSTDAQIALKPTPNPEPVPTSEPASKLSPALTAVWNIPVFECKSWENEASTWFWALGSNHQLIDPGRIVIGEWNQVADSVEIINQNSERSEWKREDGRTLSISWGICLLVNGPELTVQDAG